MNESVAGAVTASLPAMGSKTVTLFDGGDLWGGPGAADYRHGGRVNVAYADSSCLGLSESQFRAANPCP